MLPSDKQRVWSMLFITKAFAADFWLATVSKNERHASANDGRVKLCSYIGKGT